MTTPQTPPLTPMERLEAAAIGLGLKGWAVRYDDARQLASELMEAQKDRDKWEKIARNIDDFRDAFVRGEKKENERLLIERDAAREEAGRLRGALMADGIHQKPDLP